MSKTRASGGSWVSGLGVTVSAPAFGEGAVISRKPSWKRRHCAQGDKTPAGGGGRGPDTATLLRA